MRILSIGIVRASHDSCNNAGWDARVVDPNSAAFLGGWPFTIAGGQATGTINESLSQRVEEPLTASLPTCARTSERYSKRVHV